MTKPNNDAPVRIHKPVLKRVQTEARRRDTSGKAMLETMVKEWFAYKKAEKANK